MRLPRWLLVLIAIASCAAAFAAKTLWDAGEFRRLEPRLPGPCRQVAGVPSSEDITVDRETGIALVSAADRRGGTPGAIFEFDLSDPAAQPVRLAQDFPADFHPHGISLFRDDQGHKTLLVVNHRRDGHFVEVYDYFERALRHRRSIGSPLMHSPNDLAATGPDSFYVTNDHRAESGFGRALEEYLQLARSYLLYFDGREFQIAAAGLAYPNGVQLSADGRMVYVGASVGRTISIYRRNPADNQLRLEQVIDAGTGVDNIELDEQGHLWIGAHPRLLTFVQYMADPAEIAPSEVLEVMLFPQRGFQITRVLVDDGSLLSASSVAAVWKGHLLVGSVADRRFLVCRLGGGS